MPILTFRLPDHLKHRLEQEARREKMSCSEFVRQAISCFLARRQKDLFMADIISAAKALQENPMAAKESAALARACVTLDIEAIDKAEANPDSASSEIDTGWWK